MKGKNRSTVSYLGERKGSLCRECGDHDAREGNRTLLEKEKGHWIFAITRVHLEKKGGMEPEGEENVLDLREKGDGVDRGATGKVVRDGNQKGLGTLSRSWKRRNLIQRPALLLWTCGPLRTRPLVGVLSNLCIGKGKKATWGRSSSGPILGRRKAGGIILFCRFKRKNREDWAEKNRPVS